MWDGGAVGIGHRTRVLRATGISDDGTSASARTAEAIGHKIEAELNGVHGSTRARQVRRTRSLTLEAAYSARIAAIRRKGGSEASVGITVRSSSNPLEYFGPDRDLDLEPITSEDFVAYADYSLGLGAGPLGQVNMFPRKAGTVWRELLELRCGLKALNEAVKSAPGAQGVDMGVHVPEMPDLGDIHNPCELWLTPEQSSLLYAHLDEQWREHYLMHRCMGLSYGELYKITRDDLLPQGRVPSPEHLSVRVLLPEKVRVRGSKREQRDRVLPVPSAVRGLLSGRAASARPGAPLFEVWSLPSVQLTAAARRAGLVPMGYREGGPKRRRNKPGRFEGERPAQGKSKRPIGRTWASEALPWSVSVNVLRASFCTELVLHDVHPKKIAALMGHTTTATANRWYARLRGEDLGDVLALVEDPAHAPALELVHVPALVLVTK